MNKWMVRFWGLLALVSLAMLVATAAWPMGPPAGAGHGNTGLPQPNTVPSA